MESGQHRRARETAASVAQYVLLGGVAAVAAGISAQGLTGFARSSMELAGPWPYLLFLALDGAAGVCAVLLVRRAARAESSLASRLAVWGLVAASSTFNWTHAPHHPAAPQAFGLMAEAATGHVRVTLAAKRLYQLRTALATRDQRAERGPVAASRIRRAERRAHRALTRVGFTDPDTAAAVLRQVQVLTMTRTLASLDYRTADAAHTALAHMIASPAPTPGAAGDHSKDHGDGGAELIAAAARIVTEAMRDGTRLSQVALAARLRGQGHTVANSRLRWLSVVSGLIPSNGTEPDGQLQGTGDGTE